MERKPFTYDFGEFVDRLTITSEKDLFLLPGAKKELDLNMKWMNDLGIDAYIILSIIRIAQANALIWNLEHQLRNAKIGEFPLDQVGAIAIRVREHNKTRVRYINELNQACGSSTVTEKINHLSEEIYSRFYKVE